MIAHLALDTVNMAVQLPSPQAPPGAEKFLSIFSWILFFVGIIAVFGLIFVGVSWIYAKVNGGDFGFAARIPIALAGVAFIGLAPKIYNTLVG